MHIRVMELFLEGASYREIMAKTGHSLSSIYQIIRGPVFTELKDTILTLKKFDLELASAQVVSVQKAALWGRKLSRAQIKFIKLWSKLMDSKQENAPSK